jgi:hypothetical protein
VPLSCRLFFTLTITVSPHFARISGPGYTPLTNMTGRLPPLPSGFGMVVLDISKLYYQAFSDSHIKRSVFMTYSNSGSSGGVLRVEVSGDTVAIAPAASSPWRVGTRAILSFEKGGSKRVGSWQCQSYCCKCEQGSK